MDDTHARVEEEKALDSSRLRSSARLGFATSSAATTCRVVRRKRKKRRRQRRNSNDDDDVVVSVLQEQQQQQQQQHHHHHHQNQQQQHAASSCDTSLLAPTIPGDAVHANSIGGSSPGETTTILSSADCAEKTGRSAGDGEPHERLEQAGGGGNNQRVGGSGGTRAAAASSSVGGDNTLLNRRAGKRSARRCNATGRRNAMTMDLQRLINEVHARPAIWDQKNVNYHNRDIILKMWREIARACEVSTDVAKSKWKHLRDNFRNELKKTYRGKCDGSGSPNQHDSKWVWFKSLFFLRDQMNSRVIGCALSQNCAASLRSSPDGTQIEPQIDILEGHEEAQFDDLDGDSCQSLLSNDDGLHQVMPPPKMNKIGRKRTLADAMDNDYPEMDRKRYEALRKRLSIGQEEEDDDTYHFLMSVRNPLRSLSLDRQMFVRLKIQELIYNEINSQNQQSRTYESSQDIKPPRPMNAGNGGGGGDVVSDMSNPASLLQNCTPEGSSDDAFFG